MNHINNRNSANVGIGISNHTYKLALDGKFGIYEHDEFIGSIYGDKDLVINANVMVVEEAISHPTILRLPFLILLHKRW